MKKLYYIFFLCSPIMAQNITLQNLDYHINYYFDYNYDFINNIMSNADTDPYSALYDSERILHDVVKYAVQKNDVVLIEKILGLMLKPINGRSCSSNYTVYYCSTSGYSTIQLPSIYCYWPYPSTGRESVLASAQFLAMISQTINGLLSLPYRTQYMDDFITTYNSILVMDHYDRWINGPSSVNLSAWISCSGLQCGNFMDIVNYRLANNLLTPYSYCNTFLDTEMWMIDGVSNILAANAKNPTLFPIPIAIKTQLEVFLEKGIQLVKSRMEDVTVYDFSNMPQLGTVIDKGKPSEHPDYRYANYISETFPGDCLPTQFNPDVALDISHAGRLTYLFTDLYFNQNFVSTATTINFSDVQKVANQFAYKIFNKDFSFPAYNNFWDGSDGWYRVNYSGRFGFGYPPSGLSKNISYGYGALKYFNSDVYTIFTNQLNFYQSTDLNKILFRDNTYKHYGISGNSCIAGEPILISFDEHYLRFLPNLYNWNPLLTNNDNKTNPFTIHTSNYKTENSLYSTVIASADGNASSCLSQPNNNLWFSFTATKANQSIFVLSGNDYGTIQKPVITLWDYTGTNELSCFSGQSVNNAYITANNLTIGNTYLISVDSFEASGQGSFTLFANDTGILSQQIIDTLMPVEGTIRFNPETNKLEGFDGTQWVQFH